MTATDNPTGTNAQTNLVTFKVVDHNKPTGIVASDQTGQYPVHSSKCSQYRMVAHVQDSNAIMAVPIKNRSETSLVDAYKNIYDNLTTAGLKPNLHICDNECPAAFKNS